MRLPDHLLQQAKKVAAEEGISMTALFEQALKETFDRRRQARARPAVTLPTFRGRGLHPGVDLDDSAALLDLMERSTEAD